MKLDYDELAQGAVELDQLADEINEQANTMKSKVQMLCDAWDSLAKSAYEEDFNMVSGNINQTTDAAKNLATALKQYAEAHKEIEESNSGNKISY